MYAKVFYFKTCFVVFVLLCALVPTKADAWFWLGVARTAATGTARTAAVGTASTAGATAVRAATARESATRAAGSAASRSGVGGATNAQRICVRPTSDRRFCDWQTEERLHDAATRAVGNRYSVNPTPTPGIFQVIDAAGTIIDLIEAIRESQDPSVSLLQQVALQDGSLATNNQASSVPSGISNYDSQNAQINSWTINATQVPLTISANGPIVVWVENGPRRQLGSGQQLRFVRPDVIQIQGLSSEATEVYQEVDASNNQYSPALNAPTIPPADGRINFHTGDHNPCPYTGTVPTGWLNGSIVCGYAK